MSSGDPIVEVGEEPFHKIVFSNDRVRVFSATIPAGAETLFHRHACNTYFIAVRGGSYRKQIYGQEWVDTSLPSRVGFCASYTTHPEIHRVIPLQSNSEPMFIVAVEVFPTKSGSEGAATSSKGTSEQSAEESRDFRDSSTNVKGGTVLSGTGWERDNRGEWPDIAVHYLTLEPGQGTGKHDIPFHGVWISLTDGSISGENSDGNFWLELSKAGASAYWHPQEGVDVTNSGSTNYEAVLVELL